jgi:hypothetical protein
MFLERLCACANGYFCLKVESILRLQTVHGAGSNGKKVYRFMYSFLRSQTSATGPHPKPVSTHTLILYKCKIDFNIIFPFYSYISSGLLPSGFKTKISWTFHVSPMRVTFPTSLIPHDEATHYAISSVLHSLYSNIFLSTLLLKSLVYVITLQQWCQTRGPFQCFMRPDSVLQFARCSPPNALVSNFKFQLCVK